MDGRLDVVVKGRVVFETERARADFIRTREDHHTFGQLFSLDVCFSEGFGPSDAKWHTVSNELLSDREIVNVLAPIRLCLAQVESSEKNRGVERQAEVSVVVDPVAMFDYARLSIYPPFQLCDDLRFSWRLEPLGFDAATVRPGRSLFGILSNALDAQADQPPGFLQTSMTLRGPQLKSLQWMLDCESRAEPLLLDSRREFTMGCDPGVAPEVAAALTQHEAFRWRGIGLVQRAFSICGGILADSVGYGKTAITLGLIDVTRSKSPSASGPTLVLVPVNLISQWEREVAKFLGSSYSVVTLPDLTSCSGVQDAQLTAFDIVVASNGFLANYDYTSGKRQRTAAKSSGQALPSDAGLQEGTCLWQVTWRRVVVDELHEVLQGSGCDGACAALRALKTTSLWGLTGTPPIESFREVQKMCAAFGIDLAPFGRQLDADAQAQRALDALVRQNKELTELSTLELREHICTLHHTPHERAMYVQRAGHLAAGRELGIGLHEDLASKNVRYVAGANAFSDVDARLASATELLQLCSHFHLADDAVADAQTECERVLHERVRARDEALRELEVLAGEAEIAARTWRKKLCMSPCTQDRSFSARNIVTVAAAFADVTEQAVIELSEESAAANYLLQPERIAEENYVRFLGELGLVDAQKKLVAFRSLPSVASWYTTAGDILDGPFAGESGLENVTAMESLDTSDSDVADPEVVATTVIRRAVVLQRRLNSYATSESEAAEVLQRLLDALAAVRHSKEDFKQKYQSCVFFRKMLQVAKQQDFECPVCCNVGVDACLLVSCLHVYCRRCAAAVVRSFGRCAVCRRPARPRDVLQIAEPGAVTAAEVGDRLRWGRYGTKLFQVVRKIHELVLEDPAARFIVFVQWKSLRRKVASAFREFGIAFSDLSGSIWERGEILRDFQEAPADRVDGRKVLLLSLGDSASGTNLTRANHVVLVHPMVAATTELSVSYEMQAVGRCMRFGQTKPVHLWRFVTLQTIEEEILAARQIVGGKGRKRSASELEPAADSDASSDDDWC